MISPSDHWNYCPEHNSPKSACAHLHPSRDWVTILLGGALLGWILFECWKAW